MLVILLILIAIYLITKPQKNDIFVLFKRKGRRRDKTNDEKKKKLISASKNANVLLVSPDRQEVSVLQADKL